MRAVAHVLGWSYRWSDLQRIDLSSVCCRSGVLRGLCWRTKSSRRDMVWGCHTIGFRGMRSFFGALMPCDNSTQRGISFCRWPALSYSIALTQFRRCLCAHGDADPEFSAKLPFILSKPPAELCKPPLCCPALRAAQGHRKVVSNGRG